MSQHNIVVIPLVMDFCLLEDRLPQGAPTSPVISNIVMYPVDLVLNKIARDKKMTYTRYADDITFSGNEKNVAVIAATKSVVNYIGIQVNNKKVHVLSSGTRQTVTGLVVNHAGQVSTPRFLRRHMRACLHQLSTGKLKLDQVPVRKIRGYIEFISMANDRHAEWFKRKAKEVGIIREKESAGNAEC